MPILDLAFVGNGIISYVSALTLKASHPELTVAIIGPAGRPLSASIAAGAMQAVFCEVEETFDKLSRDKEIFDIALEARTLWRDLLNKFDMTDAVTAENTIMYRRKQGTLFEEVNYEAAHKIGTNYRCVEDVADVDLEKIFCGQLAPKNVVAHRFLGEFAIDTELLFQKMQTCLEKMGVMFMECRATAVHPVSQGIDVVLHDGNVVHASRVVVAAGTESINLLRPVFAMVPLYHGVGTSMVFDSAPAAYAGLNTVVRTTNRGGAQCGMHVVPRNGRKFYLGAGNYFSDEAPAHRAETIRYLIDTCDQELFGKQVIYKVKTELCLGSRPKSLDGYPVVGTYSSCPALFVATGMYRVGLTIAPVVAAEISLWYTDRARSAKFENCAPDRELHSYATLDLAVRYYSESRISNLVEHGIIDLADRKTIADKKVELEALAKSLNGDIVRRHNFAADFIVDPDMYAILSEAKVVSSRTYNLPQDKKRAV